MLTKKNLVKFFCTVAFIASAGCASKSVNFTEWVDPSGTRDYQENRRVLTDAKLARQVMVESMATDTTPDGLLKVQVQLKNLTKKMVSVEYRFDWLDTNKMVFATPTSRWTIKHIYGGDYSALTSVAPHNNIKDFVFKIKRR